jgi:hypothetical protein
LWCFSPFCVGACFLQGLIAASDLYGEGYVDMDEFLAAMVANSNYSKTKDAVSSWAQTQHRAAMLKVFVQYFQNTCVRGTGRIQYGGLTTHDCRLANQACAGRLTRHMAH